ncbi:MAG: NADH-quinone oxidoreductase subunit NuoE [Ignavibacteriales bacterium]|nr:MAG: NADH-quinone oxidoreductase subunit NuoE [Ignavibacteriaceae bacterium]MBW7872295.1 NADH-quinone oxidoreductase subunit NuoE [Ignavibacteria bacterium]MCZ2142578.1 NADH-quinone oxidoreductase subunit NuoE [Ignavibacteriales bacterium]OQY78136.1 MAG: NADH-quinone oxidoreductase subunit E [Ignavibacteriales bacterium UTCHB3]MBV6445558.1 NADP-reducing hydrogenase subunit HndA [Ignavibacteriaceae bacterium]
MANQIIEKYPKNDRSILIPLLQDIQEENGYLPEDVLKEAAAHIGISMSSIYGVATFYNQFRLTPLGKNVIRVCRGTACHVKNSANILFGLETALNIKAGQTTRDKNFTLEVVSCIGACSIAPVICINDDYYGRVTVKEIDRILKKYQPVQPKPSPQKAEEVVK